MNSLSPRPGTKKVLILYSRPPNGWPWAETFCSPPSSRSRGRYSSPSGLNWSVVWSRTVGKALTTDCLVGVDLGGEVWLGLAAACCGRLWVCNCGVWIWPAVFCVTELNVEEGLPGPGLAGLPRFLGLESSVHRSMNQLLTLTGKMSGSIHPHVCG